MAFCHLCLAGVISKTESGYMMKGRFGGGEEEVCVSRAPNTFPPSNPKTISGQTREENCKKGENVEESSKKVHLV